MPIFEYSCRDCGKAFEELVLGQEEDVACPHCGSAKTEKLMSCCRSKVGGGHDAEASIGSAAPAPSGGGCSGCSGGSCSSCH
ncbi:MAG: zinc ribbon domain-containing protein [Humidesulfovibrio sp.]|nr:zinc ribbon domain-containing protein [Humidesulfovibrio sp.]